jgi:hypothetical protein
MSHTSIEVLSANQIGKFARGEGTLIKSPQLLNFWHNKCLHHSFRIWADHRDLVSRYLPYGSCRFSRQL